MTKREKLEMFIEENGLRERQAKKLRGKINRGACKWQKNFYFYLGKDKSQVLTGIEDDLDAPKYHVTFI